MASNQLSARELEELKKLYRDIDSLSQSQAESAAANAQSIGNARGELERLRKEYMLLASDVSDALNIFHNITQEITKQNLGINESKKGYKGLTSIAEKIQQHQQGINRLSVKEVEKLKDKVKQEQLRLKNAQELLKNRERELNIEIASKAAVQQRTQAQIDALMNQSSLSSAEYKKLGRLLNLQDRQNRNIDDLNAKLSNTQTAYENNKNIIDETDESIKGLIRSLNLTEEEAKNVNKALGLGGAAVAGIDAAFSKLGFGGISSKLGLDDAKKAMEGTAEKLTDGGKKAASLTDKFKIMGSGMKSIGSSLSANLLSPISIATFAVTELINAFKAIDEGAGKLAKSMNMTYGEALKFREELSTISRQSNDVGVQTKGLQESYMAIGQSLGANADINKEDLVTFTKLREQAGFTNEELTAMYKISLVTSKSVEQTSEEFLGGAKALAAQKGLAINVKQLMKETSNASAAMKLSVVGGAKGLAEAAVQAKALGTNLDQVDKIADSLLQFESSISSELEAELLTGKQINLERARLAALNNDIATVAEEINKQIGGSAEFSKMNRIQQEAFAKAVGMSREELAKSLVEQEALQRVGAKTGAEAKAKYELLRKTMSAQEAAAALGDDELARQYEQQSVQERFNQAVEKLRDIFVSIIDGPLGSILEAIANILSNTTALYAILGAIGGFMVGGPVGALIGAAAGAGIAQVHDGEMGLNANGGPVVSSFQQGKLVPVMQGIKGDKAYLTTNTPASGNSTVNSSPQNITIHTHIMLNDAEVATAVNEYNLKNGVKIS
jgi:hypothetical protein